MTPPNPMTTEQHRARWPAVLAREFDGAAIAAAVKAGNFAAPFRRPGEEADHVFDWADGVRVILSRDRLAHRGVVLHASASILGDAEALADFRAALERGGVREAYRWFRELAVARVDGVAGKTLFWWEEFVSDAGVLHLLGPDPVPKEGGAGK